MPYRRKSFQAPQLLHDPTLGQGYFNFDRKKYYCGAWDGTSAVPSRVLLTYADKLKEAEQAFYAKLAGVEALQDEHVSVNSAIDRYLTHLQYDEDGALRPDGTHKATLATASLSLRPLSALFAPVRIADLQKQHLRLVRTAIRKGDWTEKATVDPKTGRKPKARPCCPSETNRRMRVIVRFFEWLEGEQIIPEGRAKNLVLESLNTSTTEKSKTVSDSDWQAILPYVTPIVADMVRVERLTGMRPSEAIYMRVGEIERKEDGIWVYRPSHHKTQHRGHKRMVPLGPAVQQILAPYLENRQSDEFIFSPEESKVFHPRNRKPRTTPVYPSELQRVEKARKKRLEQLVKKGRHKAFTARTYRQAIKRGIEKARQAGVEVADWTPYALRHARGTEVEREFDLFAAAAVLGHASVRTAEIYTHERMERAIDVVRKESKKQTDSK